MAISFRPFGPSGGYPHTESLVVATGATIAIGDPVIYNGSGLIAVGAATSPSFAGVAASACSSAAAGTEIDVYNDPDQEFLVACSGTPTQAMAGNFVDVEGTTGAFECNENASTYRVVQIVGFAPGESTGSGASVRVKIARHATEADESGTTYGDLVGDVTGDVSGDLTGNVLADDTNPIVTSGATVAASSIDVGTIAGALTGAVTGDVTGNVLADDTNPIVTSGATTAASSIAVGSAVLSGDLSIGGHIDGVEVNCNPLPTNPSTEWGFIAKYFSHVPQSQSAVVLYCQPQLAIGDEIVGARVSGTALENNAITLDAALVSVAQDGTESVLTATTGFTQVDANGDFTGSWSLDAVETVAINKNCFVKLTATTGATDTISVLAVTVTKNAKC